MSTISGKVILVEDDADLRHALEQGLDLEGFEVEAFADPFEARELVNTEFPGIVVTDIRMPSMDGMDLMASIFEIDAALPVILITGHGDVPLAVKAMQAGAYEFLEKPFSPSRLGDVVARALHQRRLVMENRALRAGLAASETLEEVLVGSSPGMRKLRAEVLAVAGTDADVLVHGETGAGKEVVSRAIHRAGERSGKPFVALNCGALPTELIESELFGHEKGAFTGAHERRIGKIEHANGGTILLDEIESMPIELQIKLLRVLEDRTIERLGSNEIRPVDVRFIAATKVDLEKAGKQGTFRQDLFYRLNVVNLWIPPLRERKDDIPDLFFHLCRLARARYRKEIPDMTPGLLAWLQAQEWPGNVRELRNVADRFVLGLWREEATGSASGAAMETANADLRSSMDSYEKRVIEDALRRNGGILKSTYEQLGISRKSLYDKMKRFGIEADSDV